MFAYTVLVLAVLHAVQVWKDAAATTHARRTIVLLGLILVQAAIGIATLLMSVPLDLGLTHQFVALMVLAFAVAHWRATKGAYEG
jgi:cytochrome c oxidase assembly protein subunit 15